MPRFFVSPSQITDSVVTITGEDAHHISRSLRMRVGESLTVCDGAGTDFDCVIGSFTSDTVTLTVRSSMPSAGEAPYRAAVYQSLVRGEKFDTVIQKSVEYGASRIVPVITSRAEVKLSPADAEKKRVRWQRIAAEAAKQCGRGVVPEVAPAETFAEAVASAPGLKLFCYENEHTVHLRDALADAAADGDVSEVSIFVGPEGGYSEAEAEAAEAALCRVISLGRRILRTESAAPFVLAALSFAWEK